MRGYDTIGKKDITVFPTAKDNQGTVIQRTIYRSRVTGKYIVRFEKLWRRVFYTQKLGWYFTNKKG